MALTLEEIGKLAGVSRSTVSRVINNHGSVSQRVRKRVAQVVAETGYQPHLAARSLASNRSGLIGLVIPNRVQSLFADPYFPRIIEGVTLACNANDYTVTLFLFHSKDEEEKIYPRILQTGFVDGVIVTATQMGAQLITKLIENQVPTVVIGRPDEGLDISFVDVDNKAGAYTAVIHLILLGYKRIATITGPLNTRAGLDRRDGYLKALSERGYGIEHELMQLGDFTEQGGYQAMQRLLPFKPDALFVASDMMALGALQAIQDASLVIPDDIAIVSFDDLLSATQPIPPLTTVKQPIRRVGTKAVEILLDLLEYGLQPPRRIIMPTELVVRTSCGAEGSSIFSQSLLYSKEEPIARRLT